MTKTDPTQAPTFSAFSSGARLAQGPLEPTVLAVKAHVDAHPDATVLVFDDTTGAQIDFVLEGTLDDVRAALSRHPLVAADAKKGPGRPKLGVVAREVTLLPRHWEWLEAREGGISVALRRLVEEAMKDPKRADDERARRGIEAASRVMWALAGDLPGHEEASRALFAKDGGRLDRLTKAWPRDVRSHVLWLFARATAHTLLPRDEAPSAVEE
jgi:hypothetical protein